VPPGECSDFTLGFIEKIRFYLLFERADIANRFDVAVMSTKERSVTIAPRFADDLCKRDVAVYPLNNNLLAKSAPRVQIEHGGTRRWAWKSH
jgi:hypothetical protein